MIIGVPFARLVNAKRLSGAGRSRQIAPLIHVNEADPGRDHAGGGGALMPNQRPIPGTYIFDGEAAKKGYALNKMCFSFNDAANRAEFVKDEDAYCARYKLNQQQRDAIKHRNVLELIAAGGNVYYLAKFAGIFGLNVQDIGAQQTGMSLDAFKNMLLEAGH
jgi:protocatechuate 4,5-dioxygenase alpha chain